MTDEIMGNVQGKHCYSKKGYKRTIMLRLGKGSPRSINDTYL